MVSELFSAFQRFSEVFQRPSQRPSQSAIFLSELRVVLPLIVLPLIVLPLKTPAKEEHGKGLAKQFLGHAQTPILHSICSTVSKLYRVTGNDYTNTLSVDSPALI